MQNVEENILLSVDNPNGDDIHPKIIKNAINTLVVVYEQHESDDFWKVPLIWSSDIGNSWTIKQVFDSRDYTSGTGKLQSPDITYSPASDQFFLTMIDPNAEVYNHEFVWIPGDIANNDILEWYGVSTCCEYHEAAVTFVGEWVVSIWIGSSPIPRGLNLVCMRYYTEEDLVKYPNDVNDNWAQGFYYDGESIFRSHPAFVPEMATGSDRMYLVVQSDFDEGSKITYKSTVTDLNPLSKTFLFTSGGGNPFDKYLDPEVWPQQMYLADGTDPDVSASDSNVCVVYTDNGDVKCSYSLNSGQDFSVSTVATGAGYPAVYVVRDKVLCAYVKNGDIYEVLSEDVGATWGIASKLNEVDGTVAAEPGSLDISVAGVVWTDTRNAAKDIYYAKGIIDNNPPEAPSIDGPTTGQPFRVYNYIINSTDPDGDDIYYTISSGSNTTTTFGPHPSGVELIMGLSWPKGNQIIKAKAIDIYGAESNWTILEISISRNKISTNTIFLQFLQNHPILYQLFQRFLQL